MDLEELRVYQQAMGLGEKVWKIVIEWDWFAKDTIGKQFVKAVDSVAANLSEGFGRYHYRESKNFYYYSRGSLLETKTWVTKARNRNLISADDFITISNEIKDISVKLNNYIASVGKS